MATSDEFDGCMKHWRKHFPSATPWCSNAYVYSLQLHIWLSRVVFGLRLGKQGVCQRWDIWKRCVRLFVDLLSFLFSDVTNE